MKTSKRKPLYVVALILVAALLFSVGSVAAGAKKEISLARAKKIALTHAGFTASQVRFTEAKKERDDGITKYEIEFVKGRWEYEYEIRASNGKILEWEKERVR